MSRIDTRLRKTQRSGKAALAAYVMAGYPTFQDTAPIVRGLIRGGADIVEIGYPFSDPIADGPVIQNAGAAALKSGVSMPEVMEMIKSIRTFSDVPLALMTYYNIPYRYGCTKFVADLAMAGADGIILPDLPIEEASEYVKSARWNDINTIFLASPNTSSSRILSISESSSGFLYMVAVYGTTGGTAPVQDYSVKAVRRIKGVIGDRIPLGVGFGVSTPDDVKMYADAGADVIIVGSALLRKLSDAPDGGLEEAARSFVDELKAALDDT